MTLDRRQRYVLRRAESIVSQMDDDGDAELDRWVWVASHALAAILDRAKSSPSRATTRKGGRGR